MADERLCSIPGCGKPKKGRGWCAAHYWRFQNHGDPLAIGKKFPYGTAQRFYDEVVLNFDRDECLIWPFAVSKGYAWIGGRKNQYVSRLVCEHWHGPPPTSKHEAAHSCGRGKQGCVSGRHLRWATQIENNADKISHQTTNRGSRHPLSKLTETDVREIRLLKGHMTQAKIAEMYKVNRITINDIYKKRRWQWLKD